MTEIRIARVTVLNKGAWQIVITDAPEGWLGYDLVLARVKAIATGAIGEWVTRPVRGGRASRQMRLMVPRGTAGLEPGDEVAVSVTPIDMEAWFSSDESKPLKEAVR